MQLTANVGSSVSSGTNPVFDVLLRSSSGVPIPMGPSTGITLSSSSSLTQPCIWNAVGFTPVLCAINGLFSATQYLVSARVLTSTISGPYSSAQVMSTLSHSLTVSLPSDGAVYAVNTTFSVQASLIDPDQNALQSVATSWQWSCAAPQSCVSPSSASNTLTFLNGLSVPGTYTFQATVTKGTRVASNSALITIIPANSNPLYTMSLRVVLFSILMCLS